LVAIKKEKSFDEQQQNRESSFTQMVIGLPMVSWLSLNLTNQRMAATSTQLLTIATRYFPPCVYGKTAITTVFRNPTNYAP